MPTVSAQYIEGIKEGRKLFEWWKRDGFDIHAQLVYNIELTKRVRAKVAPLAHSANEIAFFDGELAFYRGQLEKLA